MDYSNILRELQSASLFDLYRLQSALRIELEKPERTEHVRARLKAGQTVHYLDTTVNGLVEATVIELNRTRLTVENVHDGRRWSIPFYAVNVDKVPIDLGTASAQQLLDRNRLHVGDAVGFKDRQNRDQYARVENLNPKTASVLTHSGHRWRVPYSLLFPVLDTQAGRQDDTRNYQVIDLLPEGPDDS